MFNEHVIRWWIAKNYTYNLWMKRDGCTFMFSFEKDNFISPSNTGEHRNIFCTSWSAYPHSFVLSYMPSSKFEWIRKYVRNTKDFSMFSCVAVGNEIIFFKRNHKRATIYFHPQIIWIVLGYSSLYYTPNRQWKNTQRSQNRNNRKTIMLWFSIPDSFVKSYKILFVMFSTTGITMSSLNLIQDLGLSSWLLFFPFIARWIESLWYVSCDFSR